MTGVGIYCATGQCFSCPVGRRLNVACLHRREQPAGGGGLPRFAASGSVNRVRGVYCAAVPPICVPYRGKAGVLARRNVGWLREACSHRREQPAGGGSAPAPPFARSGSQTRVRGVYCATVPLCHGFAGAINSQKKDLRSRRLRDRPSLVHHETRDPVGAAP